MIDYEFGDEWETHEFPGDGPILCRTMNRASFAAASDCLPSRPDLVSECLSMRDYAAIALVMMSRRMDGGVDGPYSRGSKWSVFLATGQNPRVSHVLGFQPADESKHCLLAFFHPSREPDRCGTCALCRMANGDSLDPGYVYFAQLGDDGPVKVGTAVDVEKRLQTLQTAAPGKLSLRAQMAGGRALEKYFHKRFEPYRLHGEWFEPSSDVRWFIEKFGVRR
jgi:hypothetical protein